MKRRDWLETGFEEKYINFKGWPREDLSRKHLSYTAFAAYFLLVAFRQSLNYQ